MCGVLNKEVMVEETNIISLIGYRAVGKNFIGKEVARALDIHFLCLDQLIESQIECTIDSYIKRYGWKSFRELEKQCLQRSYLQMRAEQKYYYLVACGGGVITDEENIAFLRDHSYVIWIDASNQVIGERLVEEQRLGNGWRRPSLTGIGTIEEVPQIMEERRSLYARASENYVLNEDNQSQEACRIIERDLLMKFPKIAEKRESLHSFCN
jgi:shikimate kinase